MAVAVRVAMARRVLAPAAASRIVGILRAVGLPTSMIQGDERDPC